MSEPTEPKRRPGRPRTRPLPDPSIPKRPRGRPAGRVYSKVLPPTRVTAEEKMALESASLELGLSVSELLRQGALRLVDHLRRERARIEASRTTRETDRTEGT